MSLRKILNSFLFSSSSLYPFSKYRYRCCLMRRNHGALVYFSTASSPFSVEPPKGILFRRLMRVSGQDSSVVPVLNQWVSEGRQVDRDNIRKIVKQFRYYKRFAHALQISEWMNNTKDFNLAPGDAAVHLDLISKVHGLEQAEKYFNSLPHESIPFQIYGSLLNCYAEAKALDKAEALMEKMRNLGFAKILAYNSMLNLCYRTGEHEKFNFLVQEMEEKGICFDQYTNSIRLTAYSAASDTVGMEKLLMKMEADPMVTMDRCNYSVAADGYLKAGAFEKAQMVLRKYEQLIRGRNCDHAYRVLITLYARMGRKDEIYRIWNKYKNLGKFYHQSYITILGSLLKLDDLEGAEMILREWQEKMKFFDSRVPHMLIVGYCKMGHMEKAESLISKIVEGGNEPNASSWYRMACAYILNNQMEKAVDTIKKAIANNQQHWKPYIPTLAKCLEVLNSKGETDIANRIMGLLGDHGEFPTEFRNKLVRYMKKNIASKNDEMEQEAETLEAEEIFGDIGSENKSILPNYQEKINW